MTIDALLRQQAGLATRSQLLAGGVSEDFIRAQLGARRWQALNDAAIATHNCPLTPPQQQWAAVLSAPPPIALCGLTAMACHGIVGFETPAVHIVVRRGTRVLHPACVVLVVHESRRFEAVDVLPREPPLTTVERAVIDAACGRLT
jgi:hypothetical protein